MHEVCSTVDAFGLPTRVLGVHDEAFYGAVRRVACLAAVVEDQLRTTLQTLRRSDQYSFAGTPAAQLIRMLCKDLKARKGRAYEREKVKAYVDRAAAALLVRNEFLHSLWPAQQDGRLFCHRLAPDGSRVAEDVTAGEPTALIGELADVVLGWNDVYAFVCSWTRDGVAGVSEPLTELAT